MHMFEFVKFSIEEEHKSINELINKLDDELLNTPIGDDDTIGKRLMHMSSAEYGMASRIYPKEGDEKKDYPATIQGLRESFERSKIRHLQTIDGLTEDDLNKVYVSQVSGREFSYKWMLYHFIEHLSTHRGQVATALRLAQN